MQRLGVSPHSLAQLVSETFNEMIFIHGDVHCDPHAANMVSTCHAGFDAPFARAACSASWCSSSSMVVNCYKRHEDTSKSSIPHPFVGPTTSNIAGWLSRLLCSCRLPKPLSFILPHSLLQLVRRDPSGSGTQLVLLDHGLYRQIDDDFRREYAALWRALILADKQGIKRHAEGMNAGDAYP